MKLMKFNQTNNNKGDVNNAISKEGTVEQHCSGGIPIPEGSWVYQCSNCLAMMGQLEKCAMCGHGPVREIALINALERCKVAAESEIKRW